MRKHIASTPTLAGARVVPTRRISGPDSMDRSVEAVERMDIIACVLTHSPILGWRGGAARLLERRYVCHSLAIVEVLWAAQGSSSCEWFAYLGPRCGAAAHPLFRDRLARRGNQFGRPTRNNPIWTISTKTGLRTTLIADTSTAIMFPSTRGAVTGISWGLGTQTLIDC